MTDAETLRRLRTAAGLGCNELDRLAGLVGGQVSRYERGERSLSLEQARKLCAALGCSLAEFDPPPKSAPPAAI